MIEREHDRIVINDVKRVPEFTGVADGGQVSNVRLVLFQEFDESWRRLVREAKDDLVRELLVGRIAGDAPQNGEASVDRLVDRLKVALLHIRDDSVLGGGKMNEVTLHVTLRSEREIDKGLPS